MKLLFCKQCFDVFRLTHVERKCECGSTKGRYDDDVDAVYSGEYAVPLGFINSSFRTAILNQPNDGKGSEFTAFVIPKICPTMVKED
jgi:hypothetical protein